MGRRPASPSADRPPHIAGAPVHREKILQAPAACWRIPGKNIRILHQDFLTETARHVQNIERRGVSQCSIGHQPQSFNIATESAVLP